MGCVTVLLLASMFHHHDKKKETAAKRAQYVHSFNTMIEHAGQRLKEEQTWNDPADEGTHYDPDMYAKYVVPVMAAFEVVYKDGPFGKTVSDDLDVLNNALDSLNFEEALKDGQKFEEVL